MDGTEFSLLLFFWNVRQSDKAVGFNRVYNLRLIGAMLYRSAVSFLCVYFGANLHRFRKLLN